MRPDLSPLVTPSPALQAGDLLDPAQFKAIFLVRPDHEFESYPVEPLTDEQLERLGGHAVYLRFSHMLVFQHALAHEELKPLIRFDRHAAGNDFFSQGFEFRIDNDKAGLKTYSEDPAFLDSLYEFATADGTGSGYCFWLKDGNTNLEQAPVVVFGSEGGHHVVAHNFDELMQLLTFDSEAMIDWDEVCYYKDPDDFEPSAESDTYHHWLQCHFGISVIDDADAIVASAQATHQQAFREWVARFYQD